MKHARTLVPPLVAAGTATLAFNSFAVVQLLSNRGYSREELFAAIWPIVTVSGVAVLLLMSFLYKALRQVLTTLEAREAAARHEALHDQLTGLANRALLNDRLQQALARCARTGEKVGVLMLDLDRFKEVNDTWGHAAGDVLVCQVARRLGELLRDSDTIARFGGDEFAIIQSGPKGPADVRALCERILEALRAPFDLDGRQARIGVSIGAMLVSEPGADAADVLRRADITMYNAKASGRDCFRMFSAKMDRVVQRRHLIEQRLRAALADRSGLVAHYQPQFDRDGRVCGLEALLRWRDPVLGQVSPQDVIPIAEECGLIEDLGEVVVRQACAAARRWPHLTIAINISPLQFRNAFFARQLIAAVEAEGVSCDRLELEITENLLIQHGDVCASTLQQLRRGGFRIALDDFGTGYSSLSYLRHFKVDKIKLDRSFIADVEAPESGAILRAAVALGEAMGLQVVAEGICTDEQERAARAAGCHGFQGFLYAPALPADEVDGLLASVGKRAAA